MKDFLTRLLCLIALVAAPAFAGQVVINEIMYHPSPAVQEDTVFEWIEIHNTGTNAINLAGWKFTKGISYTIPAGVVIPAGGYRVVVPDVERIEERYPQLSNILGPWAGTLGNNGEEIELQNALGETESLVAYASEGEWAIRQRGPLLLNHRGWVWFTEADGLGKSLELINPNLPAESGQNWAASLTLDGTPGAPNSVRSADIAPLIIDTIHSPAIPKSTDPVTISARIIDETTNGLAVTLHHRVDANPQTAPFLPEPMFDDGAHGDGLPGDGVYAVTLLPRPNNTVIEFYVEAKDTAGNTRTYPAPTQPTGTQTANLLYQVDNSAYVGHQAIYRLIMTEAERAELASIPPSGDRESDALMNGTFISADGSATPQRPPEVRYLAGFRNRGHGSRGANPPNYRINLPADKKWNGQRHLNIGSQYTHNQVMGSVLFQSAGLPQGNSRPIQLRVNGANLARTDNRMYGSYAHNEELGSEFLDQHFPTDAAGNLYRGIRIDNPQYYANFTYLGPTADSCLPAPNCYRNLYFKQNNTSADDFSDIIDLCNILSNADDENYLSEIHRIADVPNWMLYFALNTLVDNRETSLSNGDADDYAMYRSGAPGAGGDGRFRLMAYDTDTILGGGDNPGSTTAGLFLMNTAPAGTTTIARFMNRPELTPLYYATLRRLIETTFSPGQLDPLLDRTLGGWLPNTAINTMKTWQAQRNAYVLSQIPTNLTLNASLPQAGLYLQSASSTVTLGGRGNVIETRSIRVNGSPAVWNHMTGNWTISGLALHPGVNRVLVQAINAAGQEFQRLTVDIWYNDGSVVDVSGTLSSSTTWTAAGGPYNVTAQFTVPSGVTLTIQPGASVYFASGVGMTVNGRLVAQGTDTQHIRFTRPPGSVPNDSWTGLNFSNSGQTNLLSYVDIDLAGSGGRSINLASAVLVADHLTFQGTTRTLIELSNSSLHVRDSVFPTLTGSEHIHGGTIPANGFVIVERNVFGTTTGLNDIIDFSNAQRPGPILQILDNTFTGSSDDVLDLDGADAHIEGNVFMNVHKLNTGVGDTASAISFGQEPPPPTAGYAPHIVAVRNLFYDVDHIALVKESSYLTLINNTAVGIGIAAVNFSEPERNTMPGAGANLDANIFWNLPGWSGTNFQNINPTNGTPNVAMVRGITSATDGTNLGFGNLNVDPRLVGTNTAAYGAFTITNDFRLRSGSPALGTGPNGSDRGALVRSGASISGEPIGTTGLNSAVLLVGGPSISNYMYRVNGGAWSGEFPVSTPISLSGLANGVYTVFVVGRNDAGVWQAFSNATASRTWAVTNGFARVRINELLAANASVLPHEDTYPDMVELYNESATTINLSGMGLTDDVADKFKFRFPTATTLGPGEYLVVYADSENTSGIHLGFGLRQNGDTLHLYTAGGILMDSIQFGLQLADWSIGRLGDGTWGLTVPTFGAANIAQPIGETHGLKLNEWLADAGPVFGEDFVELYSTETLPLNLAGLYLTDAPYGAPKLHRVPELSFMRGFGVFIADGNPENGADHLNFKLSPQQGQIALYGADLTLLDSISYGQQTTDVSEGRRPSGSANISFFSQPTPGGPNPGGSISVTNVTIGLLTMNESWRYDRSNIDLGTAWRGTDFNDATWQTGPGPLGVEGDSIPFPIQTFFSSYNQNQITYYFRTQFVVNTNLAGFTLTATAEIDDGAVIYINGAEAQRVRMPATGQIFFNTPASSPSVNNASLEVITLPMTNLVQGTNIIAVEVHQASLPSSDLVMGLALDAVRTITNRTVIPLVVNEVMARNANTPVNGTNLTDWVELYNDSDDSIDLTGVGLSDRLSEPQRWVVPNGVSLPPRGHLVVRFDADSPASTSAGPDLNTGFSLSADEGDSVYLFDAVARSGALIDSVTFGMQVTDFTIAQVPDASMNWVLALPSPGGQNVATVLGDVSLLRINEWMADPPSGDDDYVELYNPNPQPVDLGNLFLTDDLNDKDKHRIQPLSFIGVGVNGYALFIADEMTINGANHVDFRLSGGGEAIGLFRPGGSSGGVITEIDSVQFGDQQEGVSEGRFPDGSTNVVRFVGTPTPGESNLLPIQGIVINEVLTHSDPPFEDAIELRNISPAAIDVSGWYLSDSQREPRKFRIPNGTVLIPEGFVVFYERDFNPFPGVSPSFSLSSINGDEAYLFTADVAGNLSGFRGAVKFGAAANHVSFGRHVTSVGADFTALSARTFGADSPASVEQFRTGTGASNAPPRLGPVIITEVHYHPPNIGTNENVLDEFIELVNGSQAPVPLFDPAYPTNTWRLRDAVDFEFPPGVTLEGVGTPAAPGFPTNAVVLVAGFDPGTNAAFTAAFRSRFGVPAGVRIFGPWRGRLANDSENIELYQPEAPQPPEAADAGFVPYVEVDKVRYGDVAPWPALADGVTNGSPGGLGWSLNRTFAGASQGYGNDPVSWIAKAPTPGQESGVPALVLPVITSFPADHTVLPGASDSLSVVATGAGPLAYQWRFNGVLIPGATGATLALNNFQAASAGTYSVLAINGAGSAWASVRVWLRSPPVIVREPQDLEAAFGGSAVFSVLASGTPPLSYQWQRDGVDLPGRTGPALVLTNLQGSDVAGYRVVVGNGFGSATSVSASLVVLAAPAIVAQPQGTNVFVGMSAVLSVGATGDAPLRFQWRRNNQNLPGATNATLTVSNAQLSDAGNYRVLVENSVGSVLSDVASVNVTVPPTVTVVASDAVASEPAGNPGQFTITRTGSTAAALAVGFTVSGGAVPGSDYVALDSAVIIPAGASSTTVDVSVIDDSTLEGNETVIVTLTGGFDQTVGTPGSATVTIFDNDNLPPSVTLTSPANGSMFAFPATVNLTAIAADTDGSVVRVEFHDNGTNKIGEATSAPYALIWTNAIPGVHVLTAVVSDNLGSTGVSTPVSIVVNAPPTVNITAPSNGTVLDADSDVTITAAATDSDGVITQVQFFEGVNLIGTSSLPTSITPKADYQLQNSLGPVAGQNAPALANLGNNTFNTATVDGTSRTVLRFAQNDGLSLGQANGVIPNNIYTVVLLFSFNDVTSWRRIIDFKGGASDTGLYALDGNLYFFPISMGSGGAIPVNTFVQVVLTRDASKNVVGYVNGVQFFSFVDTANDAALDGNGVLRFFRDDGAEGSAGAIARLRVFDTALSPNQVAALDRLPGTGPALSTYSITWNDVAAGNYTLTARATDNRGAVSVSAPVNITVRVPLPGFGDMFASRGAINGFTNFITGTNTTYTRENGEPRHDNRGGARSAWVSWTAPMSGLCAVDTFGSSFDTVLAVYTGTLVSNLFWVASNDDASLTTVQSRIAFNATAGTTYQIAVDGYAVNASGTIVFHLNLPLSSPVITAHPQTVVVNPGGVATFSVSAVGVAPLSYQWRSNGVIVPGATSSVFTWNNVQYTDGASYSAVVINGLGLTNSRSAELIVRPTIVSATTGDGEFRLMFNGMPNRAHAIEMSSSGIEWVPLNTNLTSSVLGQFLEPNPGGQTSRLYRVRVVQ